MISYRGKILGLDYGTKRIGIAVSDPTRLIAQGVGTWANDLEFSEKLLVFINSEEVTRIVIGIPYSGDGGMGKKAQEVEAFMNHLKQQLAIPIETWDESYSSVNASRAFIESGMKRKKRQQKARVDEMAARLMLQEYLDHTR